MPEYDTRVKRIFRKTGSISETAKQCGVSIATVYRRLDGADLKLIRQVAGRPEEERATISVLSGLGFPHRQIAEKLAVTPQYINQLLHYGRTNSKSA